MNKDGDGFAGREAPLDGAPDSTRIFVSYSRKDRLFVDRLVAALQVQAGIDVLRDTEDILPAEEWQGRLGTLIGESDCVVFCLSPHSSASGVCAWEVETAEALHKRIVPVLIQDVEGAVPHGIARLNYVLCRPEDDFDKALAMLVAALQADIGWIREHTRLGELARRWERSGRHRDQNLHGVALSEAEAWVKYRPPHAPQLTTDMVAFIKSGREAEEVARRRIRRTRALVTSLLLGIIAGLVGWINQDFIKERWHWYTIDRPYIGTHIAPYLLSPQAERALQPRQAFRECAQHCPELVVIPAGRFQMGSATGDSDELPVHEVTIQSLAVSKFEVTQAEWQECVALEGCTAVTTDFGAGRQPVIKVSWHDAQRYVRWLSKFTGKHYRLLSEAEWEYTARANSTTAYSFGDDAGVLCSHANVRDQAGERLYPHWRNTVVACDDRHGAAAPVGSYLPNPFGLYDVHGNLWEWVEDCWNNSYAGAPADGSAWTTGDCSFRVERGGSWDNGARDVRSANRYRGLAGSWAITTGFRVARTIQSP